MSSVYDITERAANLALAQGRLEDSRRLYVEASGKARTILEWDHCARAVQAVDREMRLTHLNTLRDTQGSRGSRCMISHQTGETKPGIDAGD